VVFSRENPQERVGSYKVCCRVLEFIYKGVSGDMHVYTGLLKEMCVHLGKHAISMPYNRETNSRFVCSCISLSEPLSLLQEPRFCHNKIISILVFPLGIF
jgi:hypothetical protein